MRPRKSEVVTWVDFMTLTPKQLAEKLRRSKKIQKSKKVYES